MAQRPQLSEREWPAAAETHSPSRLPPTGTQHRCVPGPPKTLWADNTEWKPLSGSEMALHVPGSHCDWGRTLLAQGLWLLGLTAGVPQKTF